MDLTGDSTQGGPEKRSTRRAKEAKSETAYRTIGEVSALIDVPAHVLRFWEDKFSQIRPMKRAGGRRYYRPADVALLSGIRKLLHDDGMAIRGVQRLLREQGVTVIASAATHERDAEMDADLLRAVPKPAPSPAAPPASVPPPAPADDTQDGPDLLSLMTAPAAAPVAEAPAASARPDAPESVSAQDATVTPDPAPSADSTPTIRPIALPDLPVIDEDPAVPVPVRSLLRRAAAGTVAPTPALIARLEALRARLG